MKEASRVAVVIPARLASTRLSQKLLRRVAGRTILERTWLRACRAQGLQGVWIATDSAEIAREARDFGAAVVMTGPQPSGTDRVAAALTSIHPAPRAVINLQGDEPLVDPQAVTLVASALRENNWREIVTCAAPLAPKEWHNPAVVKVAVGDGDRAVYFSRAPIPGAPDGSTEFPTGARRVVLRHVGIYGYPTALLRRLVALPRAPLEKLESLEQLRAITAGMKMRVVRLARASRPVDTPADLAALRKRLGARRSTGKRQSKEQRSGQQQGKQQQGKQQQSKGRRQGKSSRAALRGRNAS